MVYARLLPACAFQPHPQRHFPRFLAPADSKSVAYNAFVAGVKKVIRGTKCRLVTSYETSEFRIAMSYREPTLTELYAEWHLTSGSLPPDRFFDIVPLLKNAGFSDVEFGSIDTIQVAPASDTLIEGTVTPRVRCWSVDRSKLVQLGPDVVITNIVNPAGGYPGWAPFVEGVVRPSLAAVRHSVPSVVVVSIALTAIDRMTVKRDQTFTLASYLDCTGCGLPKWCEKVREACDIRVGRGILESDGFNRQIQIIGRPSNDEYVIQMASIFHDAIKVGQNEMVALENLHDESNEWFEAVITDRTRSEVMKGTLDVAVHS